MTQKVPGSKNIKKLYDISHFNMPARVFFHTIRC